MEKLAHDPNAMVAPQVRKVKPATAPPPVATAAAVASKKKVVKSTNNATTGTSSSAPRRTAAPPVNASDWGHPQVEWSAFEMSAAPPNRSSSNQHASRPKTAATLIDDNGFLMEASFDPFAMTDIAPAASNTAFKQPKTATYHSNNSTGGDSGNKVRRMKKKTPTTNAVLSNSFDGGFQAPVFETAAPTSSQPRTKNSHVPPPPLNGNGSGGNLALQPATSSTSKPRRSRRASLNM
jgi:hypothetical protein